MQKMVNELDEKEDQIKELQENQGTNLKSSIDTLSSDLSKLHKSYGELEKSLEEANKDGRRRRKSW